MTSLEPLSDQKFRTFFGDLHLGNQSRSRLEEAGHCCEVTTTSIWVFVDVLTRKGVNTQIRNC